MTTPDPVEAQYEAYPYPARDPHDEAKRLIVGSPSQLDELNHYLFGGRRDFALPFRALVAGGGTGDAAIMLAQQLADRGGPGEVVYLDLSRAARAVAEARAEVRGLSNIAFHSAGIEALPGLGLGCFDYIDCCGVLHHLAEPAEGLRRLADALAPGGGMGLMVYGLHGRTGLYPIQELLRDLGAALPLKDRVVQARKLLDNLPATNWLRRNPFLGDHRRSDAELVDLLLHARDRAYGVGELFALLAGAGLGIASFIEPARYEPAHYVADPVLRAGLDALPSERRAAAAEALAGNMKKHVVYVARFGEAGAPDPAARIARHGEPEAVPILAGIEPRRLAESLNRERLLKAELDGLTLRFPVPPLASALVLRIDGRTSLAAIHAALAAQNPDLDWDRFMAQFDALYAALNGINALWIRNPPVPA